MDLASCESCLQFLNKRFCVPSKLQQCATTSRMLRDEIVPCLLQSSISFPSFCVSPSMSFGMIWNLTWVYLHSHLK